MNCRDLRGRDRGVSREAAAGYPGGSDRFEGAQQIARALPSILRSSRERAQDDLAELQRHVGIEGSKIRRLLQSPSIPIKLNSLSVYVDIQGEGYPDELLLASKDSDPVIRQKAVSMMGRFGEERFADQLVLSLAEELRAHDINVNAVLPTVIDTPANRRDMPGEDPSKWVRPQELAEIIFSLTQPWGRPIHGALIPVAGRI